MRCCLIYLIFQAGHSSSTKEGLYIKPSIHLSGCKSLLPALLPSAIITK